MDYGGLIGDAFWITWRNKFLWVFGFFAAGGGASFPATNTSPAGSNGDFPEGGTQNLDDALSLAAHEVRQWASEHLGLILLVAVVVLAIYLFFFALGAISRAALTESVAAIDRGERRRFSRAFRAGLSSFWGVVGLAIVFFLIWAALMLVIGGPTLLLFIGTSDGSLVEQLLAASTAFWLAVLLVVIVFIPVGIVAEFALRELVIGGERVLASIVSGYRIFRRNLGRSLLVWLIQLGIAIGTGIVLVIVVLIVGVILVVPPLILLVADLRAVAIAGFVVAALIFFSLFLVASAAISAFNHSYWTLAYLRLTGQGTAEPRVR